MEYQPKVCDLPDFEKISVWKVQVFIRSRVHILQGGVNSVFLMHTVPALFLTITEVVIFNPLYALVTVTFDYFLL